MRCLLFLAAACIACGGTSFADDSPSSEPAKISPKPFAAFTGKILRSKVRMRNHPNLEGQIIRELNKGEMLAVVGETEDFFIVLPPADTKAYVFRTFVLDDQIEGNHVNVRLAPDLEAPIIAQLNTGDRVKGAISPTNSKWYEVATPESTRFYVAKEQLRKCGDPSMLATLEKRKEEANQLIQSTLRISQDEMRKPFPEINLDRIVKNYQTIMNNYSDFPEQAAKAKELLVQLQEDFLNKKMAYLDLKTKEKADFLDSMAKPIFAAETAEPTSAQTPVRINPWMPQEQTLFESWSLSKGGGTVEEFYGQE